MEMCTKVVGKITKLMDKENLLPLMASVTKAAGWMTCSTALEKRR